MGRPEYDSARTYYEGSHGYAGTDFHHFLTTETTRYNAAYPDHQISETELLAGIVETIRKIQWDTIKVMARHGEATLHHLPKLFISPFPMQDLLIFEKALEQAKGRFGPRYGLFDQRNGRSYLHRAEQDVLDKMIINSLGSGNIVGGVYQDDIVGLNSTFIIEWLTQTGIQKSFTDDKAFVHIAIEEEVHHQGYRQAELDAARERRPRIQGTSPHEVAYLLQSSQDVEVETGIKQFISQVAEELERTVPREELLEPLERWAPGYLQMLRENAR